MALSNLIGHWQHHDIIVNVLQFQFCAFIGIFIKGLIKTNANLSTELNFPDISRGSFTLHATHVVYKWINIRRIKFIP